MGWSFTMSKIPSDDVLESLYKLRIRESAQLKTVLELYDMDIHQKNIDAQSPKIEDNGEKEYRSEATITKFRRQKRENWVRSSGQESQGIKWRWRWKRYLLPVEKKKANVRRKTSAVSGMRGTIVHKNRHQMPPHFLSQQWHEVEVCRGKEVSRAKVILVSFLDNRVDTMWKVLARNRLVSIGILPNVNSTKQNRDVKQGISVCSSIIRLMNTQTKSRKRATIQQKYEKATTKMQWLSWKLYLRWVASRKTGSYWILKEATKPGETRCKKSLGTDSKSTIHSVYATSSKKGPSLGTIQVKNPHQRSPYAMKFEDRSQEETQRQQRCARGKGWNLAERIDKLKEKDMATFNSPAEEWVVLAASTKEPAERKFMVDSGASTHVVSKKDLNSAELETMRDIENSFDGDDSQRRCANQRRSHGIRQRLGHIRDSYASWRNTRSSVTRKTLRRTRVFSPLDQWSKTTYHQKWQEDRLQHSELCTIRCPWFIDEFLDNTHTFFFNIFITGFCIWRQQIHRKSSTERRRNPLHRSTETENTNYNEGREEVQSDLLHDLPDWL